MWDIASFTIGVAGIAIAVAGIAFNAWVYRRQVLAEKPKNAVSLTKKKLWLAGGAIAATCFMTWFLARTSK